MEDDRRSSGSSQHLKRPNRDVWTGKEKIEAVPPGMASSVKIDGERSSVGRALDCDSSRRGFESHRSPHLLGRTSGSPR